jgi:hypothetical protein
MLCRLTGLNRTYADRIVIVDAATADAWRAFRCRTRIRLLTGCLSRARHGQPADGG